jgi:hypothetical protein
MKQIAILLLSTLLLAPLVNAEVVDAGYFKVSIPESMFVEWNQRDTILAGVKGEQYSFPMLGVGYKKDGDAEEYLLRARQLLTKMNADASLSEKELSGYKVHIGNAKQMVEGKIHYGVFGVIEGNELLILLTVLDDVSEESGMQFFKKILGQILDGDI